MSWPPRRDELAGQIAAWTRTGDDRARSVAVALEAEIEARRPLEFFESRSGSARSTNIPDDTLALEAVERYRALLVQQQFGLAESTCLEIITRLGLPTMIIAKLETDDNIAELERVLADPRAALVDSVSLWLGMRPSDRRKTLLPLLGERWVRPRVFDTAIADAWLPTLAELPRLSFRIARSDPGTYLLDRLDQIDAPRGEVRLELASLVTVRYRGLDEKDDERVRGNVLAAFERIAARCSRLELTASELEIGDLYALLLVFIDAFDDVPGVLIHDDQLDAAWLTTESLRSSERLLEIDADGALLVDRKGRVVWRSSDAATFEHEGKRYRWIERGRIAEDAATHGVA